MAVLAVVGWFPPNQLVMLGSGLTFTAPALLICPSGPRHAAAPVSPHSDTVELHTNIRDFSMLTFEKL